MLDTYMGFRLGVVSFGKEVKELLEQTGVPQDELLRFHQMPPSPELQAEHQQAIAEQDWIFSSFEFKTTGRTVWIVTDPQRKTTGLYLEPA
jgi:hypothetical protein